MEHIWIEKNRKGPTLILLHGTGGDERSLLELGKMVAPDANLLALRGQVNENGMLRFFARKAMGVYDQDDLELRSRHIIEFLEDHINKYGLEDSPLYLFGFSNGANMGIHLLLKAPSLFKGAVLMAPMYPLEPNNQVDWSNHDIFLSFGQEDPMCTLEDSAKVAGLFEGFGAKAQIFWVNGHEVTMPLVQAVSQWMDAELS